ncbi:864_t:CDS:1, partial [Scutellospora calospora]
MFVFDQVIDEKEEILYEFFEMNLNQLRDYRDFFRKNKDEYQVVQVIKMHIQEEYISNYKTLRNKYDFIKKDINVLRLTKSLSILKKTD